MIVYATSLSYSSPNHEWRRKDKNAMAFIPVPNTVMAEILYSLEGQQIENTLYFELGEEPSITDMEDLAENLDDWVATSLMPNLSVNLTYRGLKLTDLTSESDSVVELTREVVVPGTDMTESLPNGSAFCVQFRTTRRGRSYRGRNYISGLTIGMRDDVNLLDATWAGDIVNEYNMLLSDVILGPDWTWVVVSRYADGVARTTGETTPVSSVGYSDLTIDSQRRRLPGRGS